MNEKSYKNAQAKRMALRHLAVTYPVYQVFSLNAIHTYRAYSNASTSFPLLHLCFFVSRSRSRAVEVGQLCGKQNKTTQIYQQSNICACTRCKQTCVTPCAIHTRTLIEVLSSHPYIHPSIDRIFRNMCASSSSSACAVCISLFACRQMFTRSDGANQC